MAEKPGELPWPEIVAKAVHDMSSPLSCMRTSVEILRMISPDSENHRKLIETFDSQINELAGQLEMLRKRPEAFLRHPPSFQAPD
ncbi:MAG: hypothetical protein ABI162_10615 [Luteolibacter sp.]